MKNKIVVATFLMVFGISLYGQNDATTTPQLKKSDVENFIKNYPTITDEFEELDIEFDKEDNLEDLLGGMEGYNDVNTIVQKYGYSDYADFALKTWSIAASYASVKLNNEGAPEIQNAFKQIEMDESMTPEQKAAAKQQLELILGAMGGTFKSMANEQDIETVKPFIDKLDLLFEEE
jgi:hypothetical protein